MDPLIYLSLTTLLGATLAFGVYWAFQSFDRR